MKPQELKDLLYKLVEDIDHRYRRDSKGNPRGKDYLDKNIESILEQFKPVNNETQTLTNSTQ